MYKINNYKDIQKLEKFENFNLNKLFSQENNFLSLLCL